MRESTARWEFAKFALRLGRKGSPLRHLAELSNVSSAFTMQERKAKKSSSLKSQVPVEPGTLSNFLTPDLRRFPIRHLIGVPATAAAAARRILNRDCDLLTSAGRTQWGKFGD